MYRELALTRDRRRVQPARDAFEIPGKSISETGVKEWQSGTSNLLLLSLTRHATPRTRFSFWSIWTTQTRLTSSDSQACSTSGSCSHSHIQELLIRPWANKLWCSQ
ncbi:hypothetical protein WJX84_000631 [Apatococcus fuscideae]|uniref:Uncharacterized protein n=1 Tax=Apatococcus fuscideae TaxID=2026836 RepID=A0AAW1SRJ7_9CHLO